jgi:acyl-ACP thioesterase
MNENIEYLKVRSYEMDSQGFASALTICNYLQEVAGNHATQLGVGVHKLFKQQLTWVLSRLHVYFYQYPRWPDTIRIETWPSGRHGKFAIRDFLIYDKNEELIVKASSSWMLLDLKTLRPITMPDFVVDIEIPDRKRAIDDNFPKIPTPNHYTIERQFDVRLSDLDINQHVNNVRYLEWALESVPLSAWKSRQLIELEVSFRAETKYGEGILVRTEPHENDFLHLILSETDKHPLAVLRTKWENGNKQ